MPVYQLNDYPVFPSPEEAEEDGLLAVGGDLSIDRLLEAYKTGIFPWYSENTPLLWWSPDPRLVLFPKKMKISKSLDRVIKKNPFTITFDTAFEEVIKHCAHVERKDEESTWITREMEEAYTQLHHAGYAHSVEAWCDGKLAGGLYGVSLGKAFFGESMFHKLTDASKVAFFYLVEKAKQWNFLFIDAQIYTPHLVSLGAEEIPRKQFLEILEVALNYRSYKGKWKFDNRS
jgi:leucyl/phenylalanyl-tRNA--protein transferase